MTFNTHANEAWLSALGTVLHRGSKVAPRGKVTYEVPQHTSVIDMRYPVVVSPTRKLNYRFMAAEAYWILTGDNRVETIAPYNSNITQFSDDGETFAGAYGPRISAQWDHVLETLLKDPESRQAGLTIWTPNPEPSKDIPCTVALWFQVRRGRLNVHSFMRSNDLWLGYPYDVFNFSMLGLRLAGDLRRLGRDKQLELGHLYHTVASLHLYDQHVPTADEAYREGNLPQPVQTEPVPEHLYSSQTLLQVLADLRERGNESLRWWA